MEIGSNSPSLWRAYRMTKRGEPVEFLAEASSREELEQMLGQPRRDRLVGVYCRGLAVGYWPSLVKGQSPKPARIGASSV
jgi:hypothetical protein